MIDEEWVVTAGHCRLAVGNTAVIGQYFYLVGNYGEHSEHRTIDAFYIFPGYNATDKSSFDISLVHLDRKSQVTPITVNGLGKNAMETLLVEGDPLEAIGTGMVFKGSNLPYFLQGVELPYVNNTSCDEMFNMTESIEDHHLCAGGEVDEGTCFGDSGSPIVIAGSAADGSEDVQVGLTSFGKPCAVGIPDVFTSVAYEEISQWMEETMKNH